MNGSKDDKDSEDQFALHKAVFDNDLKKLNLIIKQNKDAIDRKVRKNSRYSILSTVALACINLSYFMFCYH